jgi:hypothetical protein
VIAGDARASYLEVQVRLIDLECIGLNSVIDRLEATITNRALAIDQARAVMNEMGRRREALELYGALRASLMAQIASRIGPKEAVT